MNYYLTRSLGALRAPTSSWRPFGPLDFVLRALWALRPCDPPRGSLERDGGAVGLGQAYYEVGKVDD